MNQELKEIWHSYIYNKNKNILISANSVIDNKVILGNDIEIRDFCVIGDEPITFSYNRFFKPKKIRVKYSVEIGNNFYCGSHTSIMKGLERNTIIKDNVIVGQFCNIGHDSIIENNVRIMNNVCAEGYVHIKKGTFIGAGTNIRNRITIGENSLIGMGSNVVKNIPRNVIAYGNPCKVIKQNFKVLNEILRWLML